MCYWYQFEPSKDFFKRFEIDNRDFKLQTKYDVFPGKFVPVITKNSPNKVELMCWGLIPFVAKGPKEGNKYVNARSETINIKPSFEKALKNRCIIPATGFYEWKEVDGKKKPHFFHLEKREVFGIAGIYDTWKDIEDREIKSFTMLTQKANKDISPIHDRMPVILEIKNEEEWLSNGANLYNIKIPKLLINT